jgi:hypothetical protein
MSLHVLRLHAGYRCRHAGVCCTEGWPIPVEAALYERLDGAIVSGRLQVNVPAGTAIFEPTDGLPQGEPAVAGRVGRTCVFFEAAAGRLCAIQRQMGHDALPSVCQHFPRVVAIDPRGIFVSLSHVCPTAGRMLIDPCDAAFDLIDDGPIALPGLRWEGLDAREALPPQLHARALWDWEALTRWELGVLRLLETGGAELALAAAARAAVALGRWSPASGTTLADVVDHALADSPFTTNVEPPFAVDIDALDAAARAAVPAALGPPPSCPDRAELDERFVAPGWAALRGPVSRYVAARAVANWAAYHTTSARGWLATLEAAYAVLRAEAARQCGRHDRPLDAELLVAAAADADRLLVHQVDAAALAAGLNVRTALPS